MKSLTVSRMEHSVKLKVPFNAIGEVTNTKITDGYNTYDCEVIKLDKALLIKVGEAFYLDFVTDLVKLTEELIQQCNLNDYFIVEKPVKKRGKK